MSFRPYCYQFCFFFFNLISSYLKVQLDRTEWGSDLPSVESHLENHKNVHRAIEEFESSLKEAKISEVCEFKVCTYIFHPSFCFALSVKTLLSQDERYIASEPEFLKIPNLLSFYPML